MPLRSALMIVIRQVLVDDWGVTQAATVRRLDVAQPHAIRGYSQGTNGSRRHACFRLSPDARGFAVSIEGAEAAAAPTCSEVTGIVTVIVRSAEPVGQFHEGAEQGGAVVVHQLDQPGLLHQAAEFDEMAGTFTARLGPIAHVGAGLACVEPMALGCRQPEPPRH
jgi:hypothetical protein